MKIPLNIPCSNCQKTEYFFINLDDSSFEGNCVCGEKFSGFLGLEITVGYKILYRSNYELLKNQDFPLSIVFSATALDCELSRLYFKWKQIGSSTYVTDAQLEPLLRTYRTIDMKFEEVSRLMDSRGFSEFVKSRTDLREIVEKGFPSLSMDELSKSFQTNLFWPRNRVLHLGDSSFSKEDANRCFNFATLGLKILEVLDLEKRKTC